ncbi:hypothetical protein N2605_06845 [Bradyrhizobium yuanmingense]|uniref:hypothetical protein n=1 Tax=Bradyrhizobium yuanmingense TaxID=108015 RepID=UPI0021A5A9CC|nr:hypothetical protein [Bradyrhizobium sp. CB1024]UWU86163.1 hypothetical protein N2605_06845 [Bradyrhizobium sp. CB1024]
MAARKIVVRRADRHEIEARLEVRFDNRRPIDITDLGRSLQALGQEYEEFVVGRYEPAPTNSRLYVARVETGSILLILEPLLDQASFIVKHIDVFAGFVTNLQEIVDFLLLAQSKSKKVKAVNPASVERVSEIVDPVAKDGGSTLTVNVHVQGNTAPVNIQPIIINHERANALQNQARRYLGPEIPTSGGFRSELLQLYQMKGDAKAKTGDRGVIEKFSKRPIKLRFMSPEVKAAIVDQQDNPFKMAYIVDGEMSTIRGEPALYKIYEVHDATEKP